MLESRQIYVWNRLLLQLGRGIKNRRHRHFGAFLLVGPDAPLVVQVDTVGLIEGQLVLVAPNAWHSLDAREGRVATLIVGADHPWFSYFKVALGRSAALAFDFETLSSVNAAWDDLFSGAAHCDAVLSLFERIVARLAGSNVASHALDPRIAKVLALLDREDAHSLSVASLGQSIGLGEFQLMRLFKRELGVRIREYLLWRRLIRAIPLLNDHQTLTDVAHGAGFYDQAHLTRTARRMFDVLPSSIIDSNARIHSCASHTHSTPIQSNASTR